MTAWRADRRAFGAARRPRRRGAVVRSGHLIAHNIRATRCYVDPVRALLYTRDALITTVVPNGPELARLSAADATAKRRLSAALRAYATAHGLLFCASEHEGRRLCHLLTEQHQGRITDLRRQVRYPLEVIASSGEVIVIGDWIADAVYVRAGVTVVEDTKGQRLELYRWKQKHVEAQYGFRIHEVRS